MDPEAVNLDYHTANVVTIELGMSSDQEVQDGGSWVPLAQVEQQLSNNSTCINKLWHGYLLPSKDCQYRE